MVAVRSWHLAICLSDSKIHTPSYASKTCEGGLPFATPQETFKIVLMEPDVSVIIPIYNVSPYIERCARSLFEQTLTDNIEFVFVDDASPDNSVEILQKILEEYPMRKGQVKLLRHEENKGIAGARLTAYLETRGKYVIHCDADDYVDNAMYEAMLTKAKEEKSDIVICDYVAEYKHNSKIFHQRHSSSPQHLVTLSLEGKVHNCGWNKLVSRQIYEKNIPLWQEGVNMWDDVTVFPRLIHSSKKISWISAPLYHYNQANVNSYTKIYSEDVLEQIYSAWKLIDSYFRNVNDREAYANSLEIFRSLALYSIIVRSATNRRNYWIERFDVKNHPLEVLRLDRKSRGILKLSIKGKHRTANCILGSMSIIKKLIRGN